MTASVFVTVSVAVKAHEDYGTSYKGKHLIGPGKSFQGLVYCYHGRKHGYAHADMVLEKELKVLYFDGQVTGEECHTGPDLSFRDLGVVLQ